MFNAMVDTGLGAVARPGTDAAGGGDQATRAGETPKVLGIVMMRKDGDIYLDNFLMKLGRRVQGILGFYS